MSTPEQKMNDALDELELEQIDINQPPELPKNTDEIQADEPPGAGNPPEPPANKPPGFLTYDQWIEKGKDPADFRGENAYKAQYESLQEVRELKNAMGQVVDSMETWKQQQNEQMAEQIEQARADAVTQLEQAKDDEDIAAALAAQDKINKLDNRSKPIATPTLNPVITEFASKNPIIDTNSAQYSSEFHQDMITIHNNKLDQLLGGDRSKADNLTPEQVARVQKWAFNQAKELHQEKFISPKNKRIAPTTPRQRPTQSKGDVTTRLRNVTGNTKNQRDATPANDIYEMLKERDPAAAETFAKNVLGE